MIYELNEAIENALEKYYSSFDDETGELINEELYNEAQKKLEELQNKKDELKEWILQKRQNDLYYIQSLDNEIQRLQELKKERQNKVNKSENFIKYLFGDLKKPILFNNFKIGYRKSKSVELSDDFNVKDYIKEKITYSPDKIAIKKDLEAGKEIKGAFIKENLNFYIK